jgi:hypothetical protein
LVADPNVSMASALSDPLHGGANEEVLKMLEEIGFTDAAGEGSRPIHVRECLKFRNSQRILVCPFALTTDCGLLCGIGRDCSCERLGSIFLPRRSTPMLV